MEPCDSVCEVDTYDRADYDDMPRLFPADQEDEEDTTPSSSRYKICGYYSIATDGRSIDIL